MMVVESLGSVGLDAICNFKYINNSELRMNYCYSLGIDF